MSNIQSAFEKQPAFIGYLTAGDGGIDRTVEAALALIEGGVSILELGVPFSDPVADGPVIQAASARALERNTTLDDVLTIIQRIRGHTTTPIILFSYYNPILQGLASHFLEKAKESGADGCLVVDLPIEEAKKYQQKCIEAKLDPIYIISTNTPQNRIHKICELSRGMLYYACRKGVTGAKSDLPEGFSDKIAEIKSISKLPVVAGFGISNKKMAKQVTDSADGVVVGSLFVNAIAKGMSAKDLTKLAKSINPVI